MQRDFVRRKITKNQYEAIYSQLNDGFNIPITEDEFAEMQTVQFEDDWIRPITEDEYWTRFQRVSGDTICFICGFIYYDHPYETRLSSYDKQHQLCDGRLGHT